jgi:hypothetical protein
MVMVLVGWVCVWLDERWQDRHSPADNWCITCDRFLGDDEAAGVHRRLVHQPRQQAPWDVL